MFPTHLRGKNAGFAMVVDVILDRERRGLAKGEGGAIDSLNRHSMTRLRELLRFPLPGNFTVADSRPNEASSRR